VKSENLKNPKKVLVKKKFGKRSKKGKSPEKKLRNRKKE